MTSSLLPLPAFPTNIGELPPDNMGARTCTYSTTLAANTPQTIDLMKEVALGNIANIQNVFVDNSANTAKLSLTLDWQSLVIPANSQGVFPVLPSNLKNVTLLTTGSGLVSLSFSNTAMPFAIWSTTAASVTPGGASGTVQFNNSGALGGITGSLWDGSVITFPNLALPAYSSSFGQFFAGTVGAQSYGGFPDPAMKIGYNVSSSNPNFVASEPSFEIAFEADYYNGTYHTMEWYTQYISGSYLLRPFFTNIDRVANQIISTCIVGGRNGFQVFGGVGDGTDTPVFKVSKNATSQGLAAGVPFAYIGDFGNVVSYPSSNFTVASGVADVTARYATGTTAPNALQFGVHDNSAAPYAEIFAHTTVANTAFPLRLQCDATGSYAALYIGGDTYFGGGALTAGNLNWIRFTSANNGTGQRSRLYFPGDGTNYSFTIASYNYNGGTPVLTDGFKFKETGDFTAVGNIFAAGIGVNATTLSAGYKADIVGGVRIAGGAAATFTHWDYSYGLVAGYAAGQISGRLLFGDGSGWSFAFAQGTAAAATDLVKIYDAASTFYLESKAGIKATLYQVGANQVVGARSTGWGSPTGTTSKAALATYAGQTHGGTYNQANLQTLDNACKANSQLLGAVVSALITHGLIGA